MSTLPSRILTLHDTAHAGKSVIYYMSRDQRIDDNHALIAAQQRALNLRLPLIVYFNVIPNAGVRAYEHYQFMLNGLRDVSSQLNPLNIPFILTYGDPIANGAKLVKTYDPSAVYFDFSPLRGPRELAKKLTKQIKGESYVVDTHNVIPVWITSQKQEYAAHTIRRKIHRQLENYLVEPETIIKHPITSDITFPQLSVDEIFKILSIKKSNITVEWTPGSVAANIHVADFLSTKLATYAQDRNDPAQDIQSNLSPYLHFGQVSSLRVALETLYLTEARPLLFDQPRIAQAGETPNSIDGMNALFEEMIVRKELSDNFCLYSPGYTHLSSVADWAQKSLVAHTYDEREFVYTRQQFEHAQTHDDAWNAAQRQLTLSGKIHGYMRMYWAKKILEWSINPDIALETALYLNDAYSIDGGDPNGYVGILWSIGGLHDRPWTERSVFGTIRYMNRAGLKRKFDIDAYITKWLTEPNETISKNNTWETG